MAEIASVLSGLLLQHVAVFEQRHSSALQVQLADTPLMQLALSSSAKNTNSGSRLRIRLNI